MPPTYTELPLLPLTDTEVVVFFFPSLSRPAVALRLYARLWGPRAIVDALHDHRELEPPYLRNTCSVKCTNAIKKGREDYGKEWEDAFKSAIHDADDDRATDLIRLQPEEKLCTAEYDVRNLCIGLKKFPVDNVDGGIFTRCVKYCFEHDVGYTLRNVNELAVALQQGTKPEHPHTPLQNIATPIPTMHLSRCGRELGRAAVDEDEAQTPSRIRRRASALLASPRESFDDAIFASQENL